MNIDARLLAPSLSLDILMKIIETPSSSITSVTSSKTPLDLKPLSLEIREGTPRIYLERAQSANLIGPLNKPLNTNTINAKKAFFHADECLAGLAGVL